MGNYYSEDFEEGNEQRLKYFDNHFLRALESMGDGETRVMSFEDFKEKLEVAFGKDASLRYYLEGMSNEEKKMFFSRPAIQSLVERSRGLTEETREEEFELNVKKQLGKTKVKAYSQDGLQIGSYERAKPRKFTEKEISFFKKNINNPIKNIIYEYNQSFKGTPRTSSSIKSKFYKTRKENSNRN